MLQTISPFQIWDVQVKNNSGAVIKAHTCVNLDLDPNGNGEEDTEIMSINPFATSRGPLEPGAVNTVLFSVETTPSATTAGEAYCYGIMQQDLSDGEVGVCRLLGPSLAIVDETGDDDHLTTYGISAGTAGDLKEVSVGANVHPVAFQVGASGVTTARDKRKVFVVAGLCLPDNETQTPYGTLA